MPGDETNTSQDANAINAADPFTDGDVTGILDAAWADLTS